METTERLLVNGNDKILEAIKNNIPFKIADLPNVRIEKLGFEKRLCDNLAASPKIKSLSLRGCNFGIAAKQAAQLLGALIATHPSLDSLTLGRHTLQSDGLEHLLAGLRHNTTLKRLDISDSELSVSAARVLKDVLNNNTTLHELVIDGITFTSNIARIDVIEAIGLTKATRTLKISNIWGSTDDDSSELEGDSENSVKNYQIGAAQKRMRDEFDDSDDSEQPESKKQKIERLDNESNNDDEAIVIDFDDETVSNELDTMASLFCESLIKNKSITTLQLICANLPYPIVGDILQKNRTLTSLEFDSCDFEDMNESIRGIADALKINTVLRALEFKDCHDVLPTWTELGVFDALKLNESLTKLAFTGNGRDLYRSGSLFEALNDHKSLQILDLKACVFPYQQMKRFDDLLLVNSSLTALTLHGETYGRFVLSKALLSNTTLKSLDYGENHLSVYGCKTLSTVIQKNTSLQHLNILYCHIRNEGARWIAEGLNSNRSLTSFDVSNNGIGPNGTKEICESLHHHPTLTRLVCTTDACDDEGYFGTLLSTNTTLQHLHFKNGLVDLLAMTHLCHGLKNNTTLRSLHTFQQCQPQGKFQLDKCMALLSDALQVNESVTEFGGTLCATDRLESLITKNVKLRANRIANMLVLSHNVVRAHNSGSIGLPLEIWKHIYSFLTFPGIQFNFSQLFESAMKSIS